MHPRIRSRRAQSARDEANRQRYDQAQSSIAEFEQLIGNLSKTAGLEAVLSYVAALRELRGMLDQAARGDRQALASLPSIGRAVSGLYAGVQHMAATHQAAIDREVSVPP